MILSLPVLSDTKSRISSPAYNWQVNYSCFKTLFKCTVLVWGVLVTVLVKRPTLNCILPSVNLSYIFCLLLPTDHHLTIVIGLHHSDYDFGFCNCSDLWSHKNVWCTWIHKYIRMLPHLATALFMASSICFFRYCSAILNMSIAGRTFPDVEVTVLLSRTPWKH